MPVFERPPHIDNEMFQNLTADDVCPEEKLNELIASLASSKDLNAAKTAYKEWKEAIDQSALPEINIIPVEQCGRLAFWRALYNYINETIDSNFGIGTVDHKDIEGTICFIIGEKSDYTEEEASVIFDTYIRDIPIARYNVWLFYVDDRVDLDRDLAAASCLPWRLGLAHVANGTRYVGMVLEAATVKNPRAPCSADVDFDYHRLWRAGGETLALADTPATCDRRGCHEIVAPPPSFSALSMQLRSVIAL